MKAVHRAFLALVFLAAPAFASEGIAFISNLKGEVALDGDPRPALLAALGRGQKITVGKDSQASVMYIASGKEYVLRGPADYLVKDTGITGSIAMPPVTRETEWRTSNKVLVQVAQTSAASVRMRSIAAPKPAAEPKLLFPTQGRVATLQPTLRWRMPDAKTRAELALLVAGQEEPVHLAKAAGGAYRVPARLLQPDTDYAWTVSVGGEELGSGRFRTLSHEALAQVEKRRPSGRAEFSDRVLFALMLQEMGATQEAQEAWAQLAQERSDLPELAAFAR